MCKLIKFTKEFFDIDVNNRKKEDIRKTIEAKLLTYLENIFNK